MLGENDDRVIFNEHGLLVATNFECPICGDTIYMNLISLFKPEYFCLRCKWVDLDK